MYRVIVVFKISLFALRLISLLEKSISPNLVAEKICSLISPEAKTFFRRAPQTVAWVRLYGEANAALEAEFCHRERKSPFLPGFSEWCFQLATNLG
jgi:hypothetical protein